MHRIDQHEPRRFAVLGSNSFSGSDFIDLLLDDPANEVIGISRSPEKSSLFLPYKSKDFSRFRFHQLDLNHHLNAILELLGDFQPEYVVNFAAQSEVAPSWNNPQHWFQTNVVSLSRLANNLKNRSYLRRFIQISSPEIYGTCQGRVEESAALNPSTPYAASKAAADLFLLTLFKNFDFPLVLIRATNVYGARQQLWKIIPRSIIYLKQGRRIPLHGGGKAIKSFIHIRDISRGELSAALQGNDGAVYHLSPERGHSVHEVVALICQMMNRPFEDSTVVEEERQGQDAAYVIDSSKARRQLRWSPQIDLHCGVREVIDWVETHWSEIQKQPLEYVHQV